MGQPFSERVTTVEWLDAARGWIHDRADDAGLRVCGPVEQRRVRPWSTQLVTPTDRGPLWFKATCPSMSFEPALHALLAEVAPADVDAPLAVDAARGWMITTDRGATLGDTHPPTTAEWRSVVATMAGLQRAAAPHRDAVLATGVPDCSPGTVPGRLDALAEAFASLPSEHPTHLDADRAARLAARREEVAEAAALLAASPVPTTVQHGDLHPWNAFADLRVFDFGDVQWAPAVEVLAVPYGTITQGGADERGSADREPPVSWPDVLAAYADAWSDLADPRTVRALFTASAFTQGVNRSLTWWECLQDATDDEWQEWGAAPLHHLLRVLDA